MTLTRGATWRRVLRDAVKAAEGDGGAARVAQLVSSRIESALGHFPDVPRISRADMREPEKMADHLEAQGEMPTGASELVSAARYCKMLDLQGACALLIVGQGEALRRHHQVKSLPAGMKAAASSLVEELCETFGVEG